MKYCILVFSKLRESKFPILIYSNDFNLILLIVYSYKQQEQLHGGCRASGGKSGGDIPCLRNFIITNIDNKMFYLENVRVKVKKYNLHNGAIRRRIENNLCRRHTTDFRASYYRCEILIFYTSYIDYLGQGHREEERDLRCSIANINLHKIQNCIFRLALAVFEIFTF